MARPDCPQCSGAGWRVVERPDENSGAKPFASPGSKLGASGGEPKLVWAIPCECTIEDRASGVFTRARVPERYRHCDFENFDTDLQYDIGSPAEVAAWNRSLEQARVVVRAFARDFPAGMEHGLLLMGPCGIGKTHLAVAALQEVMRRGHSCLFYDYRELLKEIQDSYNPETDATEMKVLEPVLNTELLLLDDLGAGKSSPWAQETLGHILNKRYNHKGINLATTNYLDADSTLRPAPRSASPRPSAVEDTLGDRIGLRIRSRLYEMCRTIEIVAPDYRKEIRQADRFRA
jgi:DNA replication protein DnaC